MGADRDRSQAVDDVRGCAVSEGLRHRLSFRLLVALTHIAILPALLLYVSDERGFGFPEAIARAAGTPTQPLIGRVIA
jgi:hypothetical protein